MFFHDFLCGGRAFFRGVEGGGAAFSLFEDFVRRIKITFFLFFSGGLLPLIPHEPFVTPEFRFGSTVSFSLTSLAQEDDFRFFFMIFDA